MQFSPDMVEAILAGRKTQTRRPVKDNDYGAHLIKSRYIRVTTSGRIKWEVGRVYAVQPGRGKKAVARIKLTGIRCEAAKYISSVDVKAEGFDSLDGFADKWDELYPTGPYAWENEPLCWVLEFELVKD